MQDLKVVNPNYEMGASSANGSKILENIGDCSTTTGSCKLAPNDKVGRHYRDWASDEPSQLEGLSTGPRLALGPEVFSTQY